MTTLFIALAALLVAWSLEARRLRRARAAVPIRIHVNGSRGKSSVTRLIAAALRQAGIRTLAKTTGTRARLITADGAEEPVVRLGSPNIGEQIDVLERARREAAEAVVMECMALRPDLQRTTERILRASVGVVTNVRADHLDVMGPTEEDAAEAMAAVVPVAGLAIVGGERQLDVFARRATRRRSELRVPDRSSVPSGVLDGFSYFEHIDNVAIALEVTRHLGIADATAVAGMHSVTPDPGACAMATVRHRGTRIRFFNIFAANDPQSTLEMWSAVGLDEADGAPVVALLNLRADRAERSLQFVGLLGVDLLADRYLVIGDAPRPVVRRFEQSLGEAVVDLSRRPLVSVLDALSALGPQVRVGGIGNIGGAGHEVLQRMFGAAPQRDEEESPQ